MSTSTTREAFAMFAIFVLLTGRIIMTTDDATVARRITHGNPVLDWTDVPTDSTDSQYN